MGLDRSNRADSGQQRGQVLILIGVVLALVVISSAITLNSGILATADRGDGVSTTPPAGSDIIHNIEDEITASIVTANRDPSVSQTELKSSLIEQQGLRTSEVTEYRGHQVDVSVKEIVPGTRLYNDSNSELTSGGRESWMVINETEELTGGIEIDADSVSNAEGPLHVETSTHDIYISRSGTNTITAEVEINGDSRSYSSSSSYPYLDLGEGSFDGYRFEAYDQTEITTNKIEINNGNAANGTIELVVNEPSSDLNASAGDYDPSLTKQEAVFGVIYDVEVQTDRQTTTAEYVATHGPTRGEF